MMKRRNRERGSVMAWWAVTLALIVLPLMALSIDATRALYVDTHLQTAADAACEAGASALDMAAFKASGTQRIDRSLAASYAVREFNATVSDKSGYFGYNPRITRIVLLSPTVIYCEASAGVNTVINFGPQDWNVSAKSTSELRVKRK